MHALALMGYDTGIDLRGLIAARGACRRLIGHDIPSQIVKAGQRLDLHPPPASLRTTRERAAARPAHVDAN